MNSNAGGHRQIVNLEFCRGAAALLVLIGHLRSFVFVDFPHLENPNLLAKGFYFLTGFGHQAVMIFFVLSGFLIAGGIKKKVENGKWSWSEYGLNRLTRLWIVLLPCLGLTLMWDTFGMHLTNGAFYSGQFYGTYNSGPTAGSFDASLAALVQNVFFLQTISGPTYGSNGPLWSLANEFWYYVLFPLAFVGLSGLYRPRMRLILLGLFGLGVLVLPLGLVLSGAVWLFGFAVSLASSSARLTRIASHSAYTMFALALFVAAMTLSRFAVLPELLSDTLIGATFACLVLALVSRSWSNKAYAKTSGFLSNISYTMYLAHFPFVAFWASLILRNQQVQFGINGIAEFFSFLAVTLLYSFAVYWVFERNTPKVRNLVQARWQAMAAKAPEVEIGG